VKAVVRLGICTALLTAFPVSAHAQGLFSGQHDPLAGEKLFTARGCTACHAVAGKGGRVGPDLARTTRPRTFFDLGAALWNHAPTMAARARERGATRPRLDAREVGDIAAYLYTLSYFDPKGDAAAGRRLFTDKQCASCHGATGQGTDAGPDLTALKRFASPIALATAMWNHAPRMAEVMKARGIPRPTFKPGELNHLIAYLQSAVPQAPLGQVYVLPGRALDGRRVFIERRCAECHTLVTTAGDERPNLVERVGTRSLVDFAAAMWNKAPAMQQAATTRGVALPRLRPDETADIVAYLYAVQYFRASGDPRRGVLTAVNRGCLDCHALFGERGKPASDLTTFKDVDSAPAVLAALWNHSLIDDPRPPRDRRPWPTFRGEDMADLMAYLRTLKRP
jgi:cytochrome c2